MAVAFLRGSVKMAIAGALLTLVMAPAEAEPQTYVLLSSSAR